MIQQYLRYVIRLVAFVIVLLAIPSVASAANFYIRDGGTSSTCTDWTNACDALPATLIRGSTYYVADGTYGGYTFDDAVSGAQVITIKKATVADHGTSTGWNNAYGDGQAVFTSGFSIKTSYWVIDGQTRDEANWFNGAAYGFSIGNPSEQSQIFIKNYGNAPDNVTVQYVYLPAWNTALPNVTQAIYAVHVDDNDGGSVSTGLVFSHMYVSGSNNIWFLRTTDGAIVEYSASSGARNNDANHADVFNLYYSAQNAIIRYNKVKDAYIGHGGTAIIGITNGANGAQVYGNVIWDFESSDAAVGFNGYSSSNNKVYNNTFVNGVGLNSGTAWGSGTNNLVYNNLFINCTNVFLSGTHNYNGFSDSNARGEANAQLNIPTSIFVNYAGRDFRLALATSAGSNLGAPYNTDILGNPRGADGVWDRGAYEFGGTPPPDTTAPTVSLTAPASGATVSGSAVAVSANAADNVGVVGVQFKLDGVNLGTEDTSSPYSVTWNTTSASNGTHTLTAVARDAAGLTTTSAGVSVTVTTQTVGQSVTSLTLINADTDADIQTITNGATIILSTLPTTKLNVRANTNPSTVGSVKFGLDGNANYVTESTAPYALFGDVSGNYNVGSFSLGAHTITATPYTSSGAGGTVGTALPVNFLVAYADTTAPSTPTNLAASAISSSQINLTWTASTDNVGVTGYKIYRDAVQVGTSVTNSYTDGAHLSPLTNYTYTVSAYDAAGNNSAQSTSASATTPALGTTQLSLSSSVLVTVNLTPQPADASIYYTTDGSTPTQSSTLYSTPFTVVTGTAVKARSFKSGYNPSPVVDVLTTSALPSATGIAVGTSIKATDYLNVRTSASLSAATLGVQAVNATGVVIGGPVVSGGHTWWQVNYATGPDGWSVQDWMVKYP